jgi:hypothetical protein
MSTDAFTLSSPPRPHDIRCVCDHCGVHVLAVVSWRVNGCCGNCGSYELTPLEPESEQGGHGPRELAPAA